MRAKDNLAGLLAEMFAERAVVAAVMKCADKDAENDFEQVCIIPSFPPYLMSTFCCNKHSHATYIKLQRNKWNAGST